MVNKDYDGLDRARSLERLKQKDAWDVIVIGGGATGLGVALDAVSRDLDVALLEQNDFCKATSSRSTKLVHGGVRYLAQGNIGLVRSALKERGLLFKNAPQLVSEREFIVPSSSWFEWFYYGIGLKIYDMLSVGYRIGSSRMLSAETVRDKVAFSDERPLRGGVSYVDGQFNDARLGIQLAKTIDRRGGTVLNYCPVTDLTVRNNTVEGVKVRNLENGAEFELESTVVINATGIFADSIRSLAGQADSPMMTTSRGTHIVLPDKFLPGDCAVMIPKTDDGRVLFAIPWENRVIVGTTDIPVDAPTLEPAPTDEEIQYLLDHLNRYIAHEPDRTDILSTFAGLRPLVQPSSDQDTAEIPRDHTIEIHDTGLITIAGGKWTTFREMAEDTMDTALEQSDLANRSSKSDDLPIYGAGPATSANCEFGVHGSEANNMHDFLEGNTAYNEKLHPDLPIKQGHVIWSVRHEMARTVEDVLSRRTRALLKDANACKQCAETVASIMARELDRDQDWIQAQIDQFLELTAQYLPD